MEKTKVILGVNKRLSKKPKMMKSYKKRLLNKVIDYFKSDFYMFTPLIAAPTSDKIYASSCTGIEKALRPSEGKNKKLRNKVEKYLKSDLYMYAPLLAPQSFSVPPLKRAATTDSSRETFKDTDRQLKGLKTTPFSTGNFLKKIEQPSKSISKAPFTKSAVVQQTIAGRETVNYCWKGNCEICC